ncbi:MAG: hypothetical protein AAFY08_02280 [Planctomycetota bacterium]
MDRPLSYRLMRELAKPKYTSGFDFSQLDPKVWDASETELRFAFRHLVMHRLVVRRASSAGDAAWFPEPPTRYKRNALLKSCQAHDLFD